MACPWEKEYNDDMGDVVFILNINILMAQFQRENVILD
jgi:hypothetical protein